jgi:hypothetical protein
MGPAPICLKISARTAESETYRMKPLLTRLLFSLVNSFNSIPAIRMCIIYSFTCVAMKRKIKILFWFDLIHVVPLLNFTAPYCSELNWWISQPEPVFVNVQRAQESIARNRFRQPLYVAWRAGTSNRIVVPGWESIPGLHKRFTNTGSCWTPTLGSFVPHIKDMPSYREQGTQRL